MSFKKLTAFFHQNQLLIILLLIAFFLRAVDINNNPRGLYGDELTIALDSYSILHTAHDSTGTFLPLTFKMGAGRPGGYVYAATPFIALFGPGPLGVRSLSILSGLGIIVLMYLFGKRLFNRNVGICAAGLTTFSAWDISLSRAGFEAHFALFLALLGTVILLYGNSRKHWIIAALAFGLTLHTYPTYKLVLPIFFVLLYLFAEFKLKEILSKRVLVALIIFGVLTVLAVAQTFTGGSEQRFSSINLFSDYQTGQLILQNLNIERNNDLTPPAISALFHNRPVAYGKILLDSYLENLSLDFLFNYGDGNPNHNPGVTGELYYIEILLISLGIGYLVWHRQQRKLTFLLSWLLIAPFSTALLLQTHALRSAFMLLPLIILSSLGVDLIWQGRKLKRGKIIFWTVLILYFGQFIFFAQELYFVSPNRLSDFWSYPAREATNIANQNLNSYDYIILSNAIENIQYAYPLYSRLDPSRFQVKTQQYQVLGGVQFKKYGRVLIGDVTKQNTQQFLASTPEHILLITRPDWRIILPDIPQRHLDNNLLWFEH